MKFSKEKIRDVFLLDTAVENMFINEYMVMAPGDYVKVYLFALMYAELETEFTNEDIARLLGLDIEDVLKAWTYWEKMGVIRKHRQDPSNSLEYDVEFVVLKEQLYGKKEAVHPVVDQSINSAMADSEIKNMFASIEKSLGRILNGTEMTEVLSWINDYHAEPDVVAYAFDYSARKKKSNIKYVEAVVKNWTGDGLRTVEAIEEQLGAADRKMHSYRRIFQALGFRRNATEAEMQIMDSWFDEMGYTIDRVLEACGKTAGISSPSINYVNKVLANWLEEDSGAGGGELKTGEIMRYYDALREKEEREAEERRLEVMEKVPRIKEIEDELNRLSAELSKLIISNRVDKKAAMEETRKQLDALNTEKAFQLTDNGFELDYMDIRYTCPACRDTGILETGERCQCFEEVTKEKINLLMTN